MEFTVSSIFHAFSRLSVITPRLKSLCGFHSESQQGPFFFSSGNLAIWVGKCLLSSHNYQKKKNPFLSLSSIFAWKKFPGAESPLYQYHEKSNYDYNLMPLILYCTSIAALWPFLRLTVVSIYDLLRFPIDCLPLPCF